MEEALLNKQQELQNVSLQLQEARRESDDVRRQLESVKSNVSASQEKNQNNVERIAMLEKANAQLEDDNKELCHKVNFTACFILSKYNCNKQYNCISMLSNK